MNYRVILNPSHPGILPRSNRGVPSRQRARLNVMDVQSARGRLSEYLDQLEGYRLCGPSDDPDEQTHVVFGFRHLLQKIKRAGRVIQDDQTRADLQEIPIPDDVYQVYDAKAALSALIPEIRDELTSDIVAPNPTNREPTALKVFVSYATTDKRIAGQVKSFFADYKIDAFLAHEDITVSQEWKDRIIAELKQSNVFVFILSSAFKISDWTSQEIGIAFARGDVLFIPISLDGTKPYGFVSHIQSQPIPASSVTHELLIEPIVSRFPHLIIPLLIEHLAGAVSFRNAESLMLPLVPHFNKFNDTEINAFATASVKNVQIWDAHLCRTQYLPAFLKLHPTRIKGETLAALEHQVEKGEHYRQPKTTGSSRTST